MRASIARRWKLKEREYNQKYKLKGVKKSTQTRDFSGKFLFLLSKSNLCTILKFLSRNVCETSAVFTVDPLLIRQISSKYVLSSRQNRRLIAQSEVRITENFEECFRKLFGGNGAEALCKEARKITPIKITSCKICKMRLIKSALEEHIATAHGSTDADSSRSGDELFIDDDIELLLGNGDSERLVVKETDKTHICLQCPEKFATEALLMAHIDSIHPIKIKNGSFTSLYPPNNHTTGPTTSTPNHKATSNNDKSPSSNNTITFKRFDSKSSYSCRICSAQVQERMHLNRHITSFHISKVYRCYRCKVSFDRFFVLLKHLRNAHAKYANEVGFVKTCNNPDSMSFFQCCFCKFSSKERQEVVSHLSNEHYEDFEKPESAEDAISTSPDSLDELMLPETRAKLKKSLESQTANDGGGGGDDDEEEDLLTELVPSQKNGRTTKLRKTQNDPSFPFRCARCLKRFSRAYYLKIHPCSVSVTSSPLKKPKLSNEVNGFFKCKSSPCNKVFTDRKHFDEHQKLHKK